MSIFLKEMLYFSSVSIFFDNVKSTGPNIFLMKEYFFSITKSRNVVIFALGKLEAAMGRQKSYMTQFVDSQLIGFCLLNLCFVSMSSSLNPLKIFSASHFLSKSITNFSSQERTLLRQYFCFFVDTPAAQSLNCLVVIVSTRSNISSFK